MKVAIIQPFDKRYQKVADITHKNIQEYCDIYGFTLIRPYFSECNSVKKFQCISEYLHEYDIVWGLDIDSMIKDYSKNILDLIDNNKNFHICHSKENPQYLHQVNAGSFLMKKEVDISEVLKNLEIINSDQGAIWRSIATSDFKDQVHTYKHDLFNHNGDFLIHVCGRTDKEQALEEKIQAYHLNSRFACCFRSLSNKYRYHRYCQVYDNIYEENIQSILEIGSNAESVRALKLLFNIEDVESVDIQGSPTYKTDILNLTPSRSYDLIIDDCSHKFEQQVEIYNTWSKQCKFYIVEDLDNNVSKDFFLAEGFTLLNSRPELNDSTIGYKCI